MKGSRHPLQRTARTQSKKAWRAAAAALADQRAKQATERQTLLSGKRLQYAAARHRDEALIRGGFVHRFFVALQEICAKRRVAAVAALEREQQAVIDAHNAKIADETEAAISQSGALVRARHNAEGWAMRRGRNCSRGGVDN